MTDWYRIVKDNLGSTWDAIICTPDERGTLEFLEYYDNTIEPHHADLLNSGLFWRPLTQHCILKDGKIPVLFNTLEDVKKFIKKHLTTIIGSRTFLSRHDVYLCDSFTLEDVGINENHHTPSP